MKHSVQLVFLLLLFSMGPVLPAAIGQPLDNDPSEKEQVVPQPFVLSAAYPNPFNPTTSFSLTVREKQSVKVEIYNMLGQPVKLLFKGSMESGETRTFTFDAGDLPTGIYLYRVQTNLFSAARQVTLLR